MFHGMKPRTKLLLAVLAFAAVTGVGAAYNARSKGDESELSDGVNAETATTANAAS